MIVNFDYQLDWAMGTQMFGEVLFWVSSRVFLDVISTESVDRVKKIAFPNVSGPHPIS